MPGQGLRSTPDLPQEDDRRRPPGSLTLRSSHNFENVPSFGAGRAPDCGGVLAAGVARPGNGSVPTQMKKIQEFLVKGDATAAVERLVQAVKDQPEKAEPIAEAMHDVLGGLYARYVVRSVHECTQQLEKIVSPEALSVIVGDLKPKMDRTRHWYAELRLVRQERLLREIRAAVTKNQLEEAGKLARAFLREARNDQEKPQMARQLIGALAGLLRDQKRSAEVVQDLMGDHQIGPFDFNLMQAFSDAAQKEARGSLKESEREWTQALNATTVAMFDFLPRKNEVGEPSDEELDRFCSETEALLRAGLGRGQLNDLIDALRVMTEFAPTDPSSLPSLVGVEPRAFLGLGAKAKLTAVRGLERVGQNDRLRTLVLELARSESNRRRISTLAAAMGGLRHPDFSVWLQEALQQAETGTREEEIVIDSIGRIGAPAGVDRILALLEEVMSGRTKLGKLKTIEPKEVRRARMLLTALGRIGRARGFEPAQRKQLIRRVIDIVNERDPEISFVAADQMFPLRLDELDRELKRWGVRQAVSSMFGKDRGFNLQAAGASPLGFRQPMANLLIRMGKDMLPDILEEARPSAATYGGGLQAFGEVMARIGDEQAVPVLEMMTRAALAHSDQGSQGSILQEKVGDPGSGETRPLTRDDVLHSLIFAIDKVGGEPGKKVLLQFADQVQSGQFAAPGAEIASILARAKREAGTLGKMESAPETDGPPVTDAEFEAALSAARPGLLKKPAKRIPGIAQLGRARRPEGLHVLLECLGDKDSLVYHAAETALIQCVSPPPPPEKYERFLMSLFENEKLIRGVTLDRLIELIARNFPKREPYDEIFRRSVGRYVPDEVAAHRLNGCMLRGPAAAAAENGDQQGEGETASAYETRMSEIEKKRQYLEKRRAWIAAGKQGPPPEAPK